MPDLWISTWLPYAYLNSPLQGPELERVYLCWQQTYNLVHTEQPYSTVNTIRKDYLDHRGQDPENMHTCGESYLMYTCIYTTLCTPGTYICSQQRKVHRSMILKVQTYAGAEKTTYPTK